MELKASANPYLKFPLLATSSCEDVEVFLNHEMKERRVITPVKSSQGEVRLTGCQVAKIRFFGATWGQDANIRSSPLAYWHGVRLLKGAVESHSNAACATPGDLLIFPPGHEIDLKWCTGSEAVVFSLPPSVLIEYIETHHQTSIPPLTERGRHIKRHHPALQSMARLHHMMASEIDNPMGLAASQAGRLQWQSLCCENLVQLLPELKNESSPSLLPGVVKRAVDYIQAHLEGPLDMAELVRVSATSRRSLEYSFHRLLQTSPVRYHRHCRLQALRALLQSHSSDELQLADLAYRWGFSQPSHFTFCYREAFGEPPSATLARPLRRG